MSRKDGVLALLVVVVWGLNFVVIKVGLHNMPPLMLAGLRFMLVAFPAIFFVARPKVPLNLLLGYGLTISFAQKNGINGLIRTWNGTFSCSSCYQVKLTKTCCSGERWIRFYVSNYHGKFINYIN